VLVLLLLLGALSTGSCSDGLIEGRDRGNHRIHGSACVGARRSSRPALP